MLKVITARTSSGRAKICDKFCSFNVWSSKIKQTTLCPLFLRDKITFNEIYFAIEDAMSGYKNDYDGTFESLKQANDYATHFVNQKYGDR